MSAKLPEKQDIINYQPSNDKPEITYLTPRLAQEQIKISPKYYYDRKKQAEQRLTEMLTYLENKTSCRNQLLVEYFGEKSDYQCRKCDNCIDLKKSSYSNEVFQQMLEEVKSQLISHPTTLEALSHQKTAKEQALVLEVIQYLLDNNFITKKLNKYHWNTALI